MKRILCAFLAVLLGLFLAVPAAAAEEVKDLVYLNESKSIVIWAAWAKDKPSMVFIAPDGTEYDPSLSRTDTAVVENGKDMYYVIRNAQAGQWRIRLDRKNNAEGEIEISIHDYTAAVYIEEFSIGKVEGEYIPVYFRIGGDQEGRRVRYRISAMVDHAGAEKELAVGGIDIGHEKDLTVQLSKLSSYDAYILKLHVWYDDNGTDIFDFTFSEPFAYTNEKADSKAEDYSLVIEPETHLVYVQWGDLNWNVSNVLVALFENGAQEPLLFDEYDTDASPVQLAYDPAATELAVEMTVQYNGIYAKPVRKTAKLGARMPVTIPEGYLFNSLQLPMAYRGLSQQKVKVELNGKYTELLLSGDGTVNLALQDEWNQLTVSYTDGAGITWRIARDIYVDRQSPVLTMDRPYDGMILSQSTEKITISGRALDAQKLLVGGSEAELGQSGTFSKEVKLAPGANVVQVVAVDAAGNESLYTAKIFRGEQTQQGAPVDAPDRDDPGSWYEKAVGEGSLWPVAVVSALCLCVIGYALVFWRKRN